jgi:Zn-dependent peptidase ImmA (M78 family)/transcriptional regulator with XRE-family HTH domain
MASDRDTAVARGVAAIFDPTRLRLARQAAGMRKNQLAQAVGVSAGVVSQYENGTTKPSGAVVARLALALGVPVEYLAAGRDLTAVVNTTAHFRSLRATTQLERDRAFAHAVATWDLAQTVERRVRLPSFQLPDYPLTPDSPPSAVEHTAELVREDLEIPSGPIPNMIRLLESRGVICTRLSPQTRRVYAFSVAFARRPVVVLSADREHCAAARFDAAHELAHLVLHHDADPGSHTVERQANAFAAAFLAPRQQIIEMLPRRVDWSALLELKRIWGISMQALLYRARTLGTLSEASYKRAMTELSKRGWRRQEPGDDGAAEQPLMFTRALELLNERGFSVEDLAAEAALPITLVRHIVCWDEPIVVLSRNNARTQAMRPPSPTSSTVIDVRAITALSYSSLAWDLRQATQTPQPRSLIEKRQRVLGILTYA